MRKFAILLGLLAMPFMQLQAQSCPKGMVNAKISIIPGLRMYDGRDGGQYWFLLNAKKDTIASGGQNKPVIDDPWGIDSTVAYYDSRAIYIHDICLYQDSTYTFYTYDYQGHPWPFEARYEILINGEIVANNNGKSPNNNKIQKLVEYLSHPFTATPESIETFKVKKLYNYDLSITQLIEPINNCSFTAEEAFTVMVRNEGLATQRNFEVGLIVDNVLVGKDSIKDSIMPGSLFKYTFKSKGNLAAKGVHSIKAFTSVGDENTLNDTLRTAVENLVYTSAKQSDVEYYRIFPSNITVKSQIAFCGLPEVLSDTFGIRAVHIDTLFDETKSIGNFKIELISPSNDIIVLSKGHGEDIDNGQGSSIEDLGGVGYANITFAYNSANQLSNYAFATDYYCENTTFTPDERIGFTKVNGLNPNGLWTLCVSPVSSTSKNLRGFFKGWSLEFGKLDKENAIFNNIEQPFQVFPNPANNELNIRVNDNSHNSEYTILNNQGQTIATGKIATLQSTIDIKNLSTGIYFLNLKNNKSFNSIKFSKL